MTNTEKYEYWLIHATYDMETAESMLKTGRWFYVVFMCQQALEKLVKGLYTVHVDDNVPRIHNIKTIVDRFSDKLQAPVTPEHYQLFNLLSSTYLGNRYPDFMNDMVNTVTEEFASDIFHRTKEAFVWLQTLKP